MDIKPQREYALIKKEAEEDDKYRKAENSSLVVPKEEKDRKDAVEGEVVAVGPGRKNNDGVVKEPGFSKSDKVYFKQYAGHKVNEDEDFVYLMIKHHDVIAVAE